MTSSGNAGKPGLPEVVKEELKEVEAGKPGTLSQAQFLFKYITDKDIVQKNKDIHILAVKLYFTF